MEFNLFKNNTVKGAEFVASSKAGNKDSGQEAHVPDAKANALRVEKSLAEKVQANSGEKKKDIPFKSEAEIMVERLFVLQSELAELRKTRGDKERIKELDKQIKDIKDSPEYKNTLN